MDSKITKRRSHTVEFKLKVIKRAKECNNRQAAREHDINEKLVRSWRKQEDLLLEQTNLNVHAVGRGKKVKWPNLEESLLDWVKGELSKGNDLTQSKIKYVAKDKALQLKLTDFSASCGWYTGFVKRYKLNIGSNKTEGSGNSSKKEKDSEQNQDTVLTTQRGNESEQGEHNAEESCATERYHNNSTLAGNALTSEHCMNETSNDSFKPRSNRDGRNNHTDSQRNPDSRKRKAAQEEISDASSKRGNVAQRNEGVRGQSNSEFTQQTSKSTLNMDATTNESGKEISALNQQPLQTKKTSGFRIHDVVEENNLTELRNLLRDGYDPDERKYSTCYGLIEQHTPLHVTAWKGHVEAGECLLNAGADVNAVERGGRTPVYLAAVKHKTEMIKMLVKNGADIMIIKHGVTPLHWITRHDEVEAGECLLQAGADINAVDYNGQTPVYWAAENSNTEMIKMLVKNMADVTIKDKKGNTPLHVLFTYNIYLAEDHEGVVRALLEAGIPVNSQNEDLCTPLYRALNCHRVSPRVVAELLLHNADVSLKNKDGKTCLDIAFAPKEGSCPINKMIEGTLNGCAKPIHFASCYGNIEQVKTLLQKDNVDINSQDGVLDTPLHKAIRCSNSDIVKLLVGRGASTDIKDKDGNTSLHIAALAKTCTCGCDDADDDFNNAREEEIMDCLMNSRAVVNSQNNVLETPLHLAIKWHNYHLATRLLIHEADLNIENKISIYWVY